MGRVASVAAALCALGARADFETMTLCLNCTRADLCALDSDPLTFAVPVGTCFNPRVEFPDASGDVWGDYDVLDACGERAVTRRFFASANGTCAGEPTDSYELEYDTCLGPFGAPRPWGVFECARSAPPFSGPAPPPAGRRGESARAGARGDDGGGRARLPPSPQARPAQSALVSF